MKNPVVMANLHYLLLHRHYAMTIFDLTGKHIRKLPLKLEEV
jgi:hypothetical protein